MFVWENLALVSVNIIETSINETIDVLREATRLLKLSTVERTNATEVYGNFIVFFIIKKIGTNSEYVYESIDTVIVTVILIWSIVLRRVKLGSP